MKNPSSSQRFDDSRVSFLSLATLRKEHSELLGKYREVGSNPEVLAEVKEFIHKGKLAGAVLSDSEERWACQSLLDYWVSVLDRFEHESDPPDSILLKFDPDLAQKERSVSLQGSAVGSSIISGEGNKVVIYQSALIQNYPALSSTQLSSNPYKGLTAFQAEDADRFFGREEQVHRLWNQFRNLYEVNERGETSPRLLPILGPSGSGKSSLVRAGLLPELARRPIFAQRQLRFAVLLPGTHPLESLGIVLARVITNDPTPVAKTRELLRELAQPNQVGKYDGLQRISNVIPEIETSPLVIFVDQFEEIYSLCQDSQEREAFIENLLIAAADQSRNISIVIALRTEFLSSGHPLLNRLFSEQGFLVPTMSKGELRQAICKPAELAGYPLDEATVALLIEQTQGREGALPLLQFTLTRIWEGLQQGVAPALMLEQIGVGGALAGEAQRVYEALSVQEQAIARRVFLGLVQLGEGTRDTRRRVPVESLISHEDNPSQFRAVLQRLSSPGVRLITLSATEAGETAEVTHEALFEHWRLLNYWLDESRNDLRFQRRLEMAAKYWQGQGRPEGLLWRSPDLDLLKSYYQRAGENMSLTGVEFFGASVRVENNRKRLRQLSIVGLTASLILTTFSITLAAYQQQQARERALQNPIFFSPDGQIIAIGGEDGTVRLQNREGQLIDKFESQGAVRSIAFSPDGQLIVVGGEDGTVRVWNRTGQLIDKLESQGAVRSIAFSPDGRLIVTGGEDGTLRLWNRTGQLIRTLQTHQGTIWSVAFSPDGQLIATRADDGTVRLWNLQGEHVQ